MNILKSLLALVLFYSATAFAHDHAQHPPHNMILLGTQEVFASHIVYKQPHNFQVILQLQLDNAAKEAYLKSKAEHPESLHIFLLDPMDIKEISSQTSISGKLLYEDSEGNRQTILEGVVLPKDRFKVIYFDEVPLSLESKK